MPDSKYTRQIVTSVRTWVDEKLFSLRITRDPAFTFQPGQFARLGLPEPDAGNAEPTIWRAYSMVSAPHDTELEFYSIVVPDGQFSSRLVRLQPGDALYVDKTAFGFLTLERFSAAIDPADAGHGPAGGDLWLLASGTGLSAYMSILRDPDVWDRYRRVIVVHGVRHSEELAYREEIAALRTRYPAQLTYLPIATREEIPGMPQARLTTLIADGRLETAAGARFEPQLSKIMLCGNPALLADARKLFGERGFAPGRRGVPGNLAVENYW